MIFFHFFTSPDIQISVGISFHVYFFLSLFFPFSCRLALSSKASFTPPTPWWSLPTPSNPLSSRASWSNHCSTLNCRLPTTLRKDQGLYNIWFQHLDRHLGGQNIVQLFVVSSPSVPRDWGSVWVEVIIASNTLLKISQIFEQWTLNNNSITSLINWTSCYKFYIFEHLLKIKSITSFSLLCIVHIIHILFNLFHCLHLAFVPLLKFALHWSYLGWLLLLTKGTINFCGRWTNSLHRISYSAIHFVKGK